MCIINCISIFIIFFFFGRPLNVSKTVGFLNLRNIILMDGMSCQLIRFWKCNKKFELLVIFVKDELVDEPLS